MFSSKIMEKAWRACLFVGFLLIILAATNGLWKSELRVENTQFVLPTYILGAILVVASLILGALEAWGDYSPKTVVSTPALDGFKVTVKTPEPGKKLAPPVTLTGTINKKLPDGLKLWLVNEGTGNERWPQARYRSTVIT